MLCCFGNQKIEIRDWAEGKVLLITPDKAVKRRIALAMSHTPDAFELMTDEAPAMEDCDGAMMVVADRERVCLLMDLEDLVLGVAVTTEETEESEDDV